MALVNSNQYGASYVFGVTSADAPAINGAAIRTADVKFEPEVMAQAMDGENHTEAVVVSKPEKRKMTASFTGYCTDASALAAAADFDWDPGSGSRFWIITNGGNNRTKDQFAEVTIEAVSFANVSN
jgi:hypothetical protein